MIFYLSLVSFCYSGLIQGKYRIESILSRLIVKNISLTLETSPAVTSSELL